jgi:hypothetical protein
MSAVIVFFPDKLGEVAVGKPPGAVAMNAMPVIRTELNKPVGWRRKSGYGIILSHFPEKGTESDDLPVPARNSHNDRTDCHHQWNKRYGLFHCLRFGIKVMPFNLII